MVVGSTLLRGLIGFVLSGILGIAIGVLAGISPTLQHLDYSAARYHTFHAGYFAYTIGSDLVSDGGSSCFHRVFNHVPLYVHQCVGRHPKHRSGPDRNGHFYKVDKKRILTGVYIPAVMPFITSGASSAMGIGWRAIIIGEVLSQPVYGMGTRMQMAQTYLNVEALHCLDTHQPLCLVFYLKDSSVGENHILFVGRTPHENPHPSTYTRATGIPYLRIFPSLSRKTKLPAY